MNRFRFALNVLALVILTLAASAAAHAQTRSWVSGTGNDADPCSFTAPCKTYAGAYNKTSKDGEISVKDTGAYGNINIQKSITIDGHDNFASSISTGATTIIINITDPADTRKTVRLRNLTINGAGGGTAPPGNIGIRIIAANKVYIEDCLIEGFDGTNGATSGRGISDERTGANLLFVTNTTVRNNRVNGIAIAPASGTPALTAVLDNVRVYGNGDSGILANAKVTIMNSNVSGNGNAGVHANTGNADVAIERTVIVGNTNHGVYAGPNAAAVRMSETMITRNGSGITMAGGTIDTFGNCRIADNTAGNGPPSNDLGQQ
jgi:hypothetical protein